MSACGFGLEFGAGAELGSAGLDEDAQWLVVKPLGFLLDAEAQLFS